jgi:CCR4-NOT transcription complex subunit 1
LAKRFPFTCLQILFVTARTIQKDAEEKKVSFNPRPYFRLFINLLSELSTADLHDAATFQVYALYIGLVCTNYAIKISDLHNLFAPFFYDKAYMYQVLTAFANAFRVLQPLRVPAWRFALSFCLSIFLIVVINACL